MTQSDTPARTEQVRLFWRNYLQLLAEAGVPEDVRPWYRKHVERYLAAHPGQRLRQHSAQDLNAYLAVIGGKPMRDWQFRQQVQALRILFCGQLRVPWCGDVDWRYWTDLSRPLGIGHPTVARDPGEPPARRTGQAGASISAQFRTPRTGVAAAIRTGLAHTGLLHQDRTDLCGVDRAVPGVPSVA